MADALFENVYNPDVLSCLANLSNDEVFTPPDVANAMLDMLPQELFSDPDATFLDPACKSGVFLREIAKRLIVGLEDQIPNLEKRLYHIFHNQLFGIAITELTSLLTRRSLYCSKYPNSNYSLSKFDNIEGNIRYKRIRHTWKDGRCIYCGASEEKYKRSSDLETHAYELIHSNKVEEIYNMDFSLIISNPPYQLSDGGGGAGKSAAPIYQKFVAQGKVLKPKYMMMIIPSRWFSGGKGLDDFRSDMLTDKHISHIVDYADSKDCFANGVDIPGGICYFLWDKDYKGACEVTNVSKTGEKSTVKRMLDEFPTFIRNNEAVNIVKKIMSQSQHYMSDTVSSRKPFGLESNTKFDKNGDVILRSSEGLGKITRSKITSGHDLINKWKVVVSKVSFEHGGIPNKEGTMRVLSRVQVLPPNSACTETYLIAGAFNTEDEAKNLEMYLRTKFVRFLLMQMLASMNMSKATYSFVPVQDFSEPTNDDLLYKKYGLTEEEISFIESIILPMGQEDDKDDSDE